MENKGLLAAEWQRPVKKRQGGKVTKWKERKKGSGL